MHGMHALFMMRASSGKQHDEPGADTTRGDTSIGWLPRRSLRRTVQQRRRLQWALCLAALPFAAMGSAAIPTQAAAVNPLPAVAKALSGVTSYQATITSTSTGARPRPTGTPRAFPTPRPGSGQRRGPGLGFGFGPQTRTIVAVRKAGTFEDYVVVKGLDRSRKQVTTDLILYGSKICMKASGASAYSCQTVQNPYTLDPTAAFAAGAGSTTFAAAGTKKIGGQSCDGYKYTNKSQFSTATGVVYIAHTTNLPCEQVAVVTRHAQNGGGTFSQTTTTIWSRFNDRSLTVPALPK